MPLESSSENKKSYLHMQLVLIETKLLLLVSLSLISRTSLQIFIRNSVIISETAPQIRN